jgi:hypothetical protein
MSLKINYDELADKCYTACKLYNKCEAFNALNMVILDDIIYRYVEWCVYDEKKYYIKQVVLKRLIKRKLIKRIGKNLYIFK